MPHFEAERDVRHSADRMFDLVADVEAYPQFVPLCEALRVRKRDVDNGVSVLIADMSVAYAMFRETFTTRVELDRAGRRISARYLDGPFEHLDTTWTFHPRAGEHCRVHFEIDYAFKSAGMAALMGGAFSRAFEKFADAFTDRADLIYGEAPVRSG